MLKVDFLDKKSSNNPLQCKKYDLNNSHNNEKYLFSVHQPK